MNRSNKFWVAAFMSAAVLVPSTASAVTLGVYESARNNPAKQSQLFNDAYETALSRTVTALRDTHFTDGKEKSPARIARDRLRAERVELIAGHLTDKQSDDLIVMIEKYAAAQPHTELEDVIASFLLTAANMPIIPQGMEIRQVDKMAADDQYGYIAVMIERAQDVLNLEAKDDLAAQVKQLFTLVQRPSAVFGSLSESEMNLVQARVADAQNVAKDPNARRLQVEDAMAVALKNHGIEMPDTFFAPASDLKPKPSLVTQNTDGTFTVRKEPPNAEVKGTNAKKGLVMRPRSLYLFLRPLKRASNSLPWRTAISSAVHDDRRSV